MADHIPAITALRDIAAHLDRNPALAVPHRIGLYYDQVDVQVSADEYQDWRNSSTDIGVEQITERGDGYHATSAIVIGSTALRLVCCEHQDMTRQAFALLVGFGYSTPTRQAV